MSALVQLRDWTDGNGNQGTRLYLWCPGCEDLHAVELQADPPLGVEPHGGRADDHAIDVEDGQEHE